jgi:hypothetical protein
MGETYDDEMMRRFVAEEKKTPQEYLDIWRQRADPHRMVFHGDYAPFFGLAQEWVNDLAALRARAEAAEARVTALRATLAHIARGEIVDGTERSFFSAEQMRAMALAALAGSVDAPTGGDDGDL